MVVYYLLVGFYFKVEVLDLLFNDFDVCFIEVSGFLVEMSMEEVVEGGENCFIQKYLLCVKYLDLVFKCGLFKELVVWDWICQCIEDYNIVFKNIDVKLFNEDYQFLMIWYLVGVYLIKWLVSDFNLIVNVIVVELLQLFYQYFMVDKF